MDLDVWLQDWPEGTRVQCLEGMTEAETRDLGNRRHAWRFDEGTKGMICIQPLPPLVVRAPTPSVEDRLTTIEAVLGKIAGKLGV